MTTLSKNVFGIGPRNSRPLLGSPGQAGFTPTESKVMRLFTPHRESGVLGGSSSQGFAAGTVCR